MYAVKCVAKSYLNHEEKARSDLRWQNIERERGIIESLDSEYVCGYVESHTSTHWLFIVMEYANGGNVKELLLRQPGGVMPEIIAQRIIKQIVTGLTHCYDHKIIHRDLKLENLLIHFPNQSSEHPIPWEDIDLEQEEFIIKIADFGFARVLLPN